MSQLKTKFIANDAVTGSKILLANNQSLRGRNAANSADITLLKLNTADILELQVSTVPSGSINLGSTTAPWNNVYTNFITDSSNAPVVDVQNRNLLDSSGTQPAISLSNRYLYDAVGTVVVDFSSQRLNDSGNTLSIDWNARSLIDAAGNAAVNFSVGSRVLVDENGNDALAFNSEILIQTDANSGTARTLSFRDGDDAAQVNIAAPQTLTATYDLILPLTQGGANTFLKNDGTGVLSWATAATGSTNNKETKVLSGTDITNQYVDLAHVALTNSINMMVKGAGAILEGASYDYSVSYTGGAGGNTRITFLNDLATGGASALVATDVLQIQYQY
jgi:hypothetical protein